MVQRGVQFLPAAALVHNAVGTAEQHAVYAVIVGLETDGQDERLRLVLADPDDGLEAVAVRHAQVHHRDVDRGRGGARLLVGKAILGLQHHGTVRPLLQTGAHPVAHQGVVLYECDVQGCGWHGAEVYTEGAAAPAPVQYPQRMNLKTEEGGRQGAKTQGRNGMTLGEMPRGRNAMERG